MHCAAINNHTEIIDYIINDLQMKELDKDDQVCVWWCFPVKQHIHMCLHGWFSLFVSVRTPALCTGSRTWVCWNVADAHGVLRHGHHEAQSGLSVLLVSFWCISYIKIRPFVLRHTCKEAESQTLFDVCGFPPSLLPERGHAPALSCQERPLGRRSTAAAELWYSGRSQQGTQSA